MLRFVARKIKSKKWLVLCLLIGNILLVAIAASSPMYTKAALQRMLTTDLKEYVTENGKYPTVVHIYTSVSGQNGKQTVYSDEELIDNIGNEFGIEPKYVLKNMYLDGAVLIPELERTDQSNKIESRVGYLLGIEEHINIISGSMYGSGKSDDGAIEAIVSQKCLVGLNLIVGETLSISGYNYADGTPVRIRVVGVYENSQPDDDYWYKSPNDYYRDLFMNPALFNSMFMESSNNGKGVKGLLFALFDYNDLTTDNAENIMTISTGYKEEFLQAFGHSYNDSFSSIIAGYLADAGKITVTLRVLQVPIYALLCAFIFMVSRQMLELEQNEISVIKSRGAGKGKIILIYLVQSTAISVISLALGIPLAALICQIVGSANAFLEFVSRQSLQLEMTWAVMGYGFTAALFSIIVMTMPVFKFADVSIVDHKRTKSRSTKKPLWQRAFIGIIALGVSLYGLYSFNSQKDVLAQRVLDGAGLDPLLFLCSSLFIIGAGLFALRIVPLVARLVYTIGKKWWDPAMYTSFLWVIRTKNSQGYIVAFLVVTIGLGIFNAQTARTINQNEQDRILYGTGTDIVLQEQWSNNQEAVENDPIGMTALVYTEPDYRKYLQLEGVQSAARVICDTKASVYSTASVTGPESSKYVTLMGVDTKQFGQTAWFKDGLLPAHWYDYLNAISQNASAILVSSNFRDVLGYQLGDIVGYRDSGGNAARGVIYGFVDYFPTYNPVVAGSNSEGLRTETNRYLIVANFNYLTSAWGVVPYQVWLKTEGDTGFIYDFIQESDVKLSYFADSQAKLIELKNDPTFQGTNGILTISFVVVLILCTAGFMIYWILSINSRSLQFGIFRAMGMTMGEIIKMLLNEQLFISGVSIAFGVGVGVLASKLYIPLVQIAYASADTVIPLEIASSGADIARLLIIVGLVIAVCMVILGVLISRLKISQALKLGED